MLSQSTQKRKGKKPRPIGLGASSFFIRNDSGSWQSSDGVGINQRKNNTKAVLLEQPTFELPRVFVSSHANAVMWSIVDQMPVEASWYATAVRDQHGDIHVDDVFIPLQTGSYGLTTITDDGEARLMEELLQTENGVETIQNLACWGHSHHTMAVFASGTDESTARELIKRRTDFYLRVIMNKRGDINATVYLIREGLEIQEAVCVPEPIDPQLLPEIYQWVAAELAEKHTTVTEFQCVTRSDFSDSEWQEMLASVPALSKNSPHKKTSLFAQYAKELQTDPVKECQGRTNRIKQSVKLLRKFSHGIGPAAVMKASYTTSSFNNPRGGGYG